MIPDAQVIVVSRTAYSYQLLILLNLTVEVQLGADHGEAAEEAPQKGQEGSTRKVVILLARVFFPMFYVNVQQAREHERKGPHLKPAGRSLSSELRPFLQRCFLRWAMPLSATPRFQFAPVASSNSSRTATLHSSVLLVGLGLFFYRSSDFFSFRVVSNFSLARGFLAMLCVVVYLVFAFVCFSHGGHSQPRADPQQKPRIF